MQQGVLRDDDEIGSRAKIVGGSKDLPDQPFSSISHDRSAKFFAGDDAEAALGAWSSDSDDGEIAAMGSATGVENALKLPAPADSARGWQSIRRHVEFLAVNS